MSTRSVVCTLLSIVLLAGGMLHAAGKPEDEAQKSAQQWLALVDAGKYGESWKVSGYFIK